MTATGSGLAYQWKLNGNDVTAGTGGNTATYTVPVAQATQGVYTVVVTGACGTVVSSVASLTIQNCTAVPNINSEITGIVMTPTIVRNVANVRVTAIRAMKLAWTIVDAQGKVVMTGNSQVVPGKNDISIYVSHLAEGIYQLKGATKNGITEVVRFVKM